MDSIRLIVNGQPHQVAAGTSLPALLEQFSIPVATVVVELNGSIVQKTAFGEVQLTDGDSLEIVTIVGGG